MEQIIAMRTKVDMVEIISWNDYGESHYIGPIRADQPNSQGWTDGMDHQGWLSIIKLYSTAFKTGRYPSNTDSITVWSRPHPKGATATAPSNPRPSGWQNTDDNVYAFITVTNPSTVTVFSGTNSVTWNNVPPGVSKFSVGSAAGSIGAKIVRNGKTIKEYSSGSAFQYTTSPADYNFNYFVGQA
jgi:glucan endo-1,3-alpha-glucosidase